MTKYFCLYLFFAFLFFNSIIYAADIGIISVEQLRALQQGFNRDFLILDVTNSHAYNYEHIDGAVNFPLQDIEKRCNELPDDKLIVTYCHCGVEDIMAKAAAEKLAHLGFKKVVYLGIPTGAFDSYKESGYPVSVSGRNHDIASMSFVMSDEKSSQIESPLAVTPEEIQLRVQDSSKQYTGSYTIVDLREENEYKEGHIEGAVSHPFDKLFNRDSKKGKYLFDIFPRNKEIFFYCDDDLKSQIAISVLINRKYDLVYYLKDGLNSWQKMGYKLTK